jgi:shikimate kinase
MVYYIGGASGSGKSTVAKRLSKNSGLGLIELDAIFNAVEASVESKETAPKVMNNVAGSLIKQLLAARISCIVEGGWLRPEAAKQISLDCPHFHAVYCAYPNTPPEVRLELLRTDGTHWIAQKNHEDALAALRDQNSQWYEEECKRLKLTFFDFSEIDSGAKMLEDDFEAVQKRSRFN